MSLIKAQCTNCGAALEVDQDKDAAICPFCNTPYIVEKAVNLYHTQIIANGATINISDRLDADTMFENWLVTRDYSLARDFKYYYATDVRNTYIDMYNKVKKERDDASYYDELLEAKDLAEKLITGDRYEKYRSKEIEMYNERINGIDNQAEQEFINIIAGVIAGIVLFGVIWIFIAIDGIKYWYFGIPLVIVVFVISREIIKAIRNNM